MGFDITTATTTATTTTGTTIPNLSNASTTTGRSTTPATKIAIFDYGAGNILSLKNALERQNALVDIYTDITKLGAAVSSSTTTTTTTTTASKYHGVFLPGVGNFDPAMDRITQNNSVHFGDIIQDTPVFGICLGMEIFFESSEEGTHKGLGVINGDVVLLPDTLKVPHMGWNSLEIKKFDSPFIQGVSDGAWVYFVHSYRARPSSTELTTDASTGTTTTNTTPNSVVIAQSDYGVKIPAIVQKDNYVGTQFHPEKSGEVGALLLENFLRECRK